MNIGQMMRSFLGETASSESRQLELKTGQVVRGVVLQVMDNNEALVQISGVQVRAKLETPLQAGQSAMLQVQPQGGGAAITLKQVEPSAVGLPEDTFKEWAKQLSLPEQKWAVEIVKDLRKDGLILNREIAQAFQQAAAAMPAGADAEQWMQAAAAAFRRGLPMTAATIGSMQQVLSGPPPHILLTQLQQQLAALTAGVSLEGQDAELQQAVARVQSLLSDGEALMRTAAGPNEASAKAGAEQASPAAGSKSASEPGAAGAMKGQAEQEAQGAASKAASEQGGAANARKGAAEQVAQAASGKVALEPEAAAGLSKGSADQGALAAAGKAASEQGATAAKGGATPGAPDLAAKTETAAPASPGGAAAQGEPGGAERADGSAGRPNNWLGQMMKWLGVDHELQLTKLLQADVPPHSPAAQQLGEGDAGEAVEQQAAAQQRQPVGGASGRAGGEIATAAQTQAAGGAQQAADEAAPLRQAELRGAGERPNALTALQLAAALDGEPVSAAEPLTRHDSLKSALFSLLSLEGAPAAVKETAQQLIQQISGQQLLLTPERNSAMLTHVTMFIPLRNQEGNQTASVHIQTRRGRKGELDASNCRLLFQLSMQTLGETMVDVNVMDKVVSLNLWNDHPATAALAETARAEVTERLQQVGYQLLSLRTTPLPKPDQETAEHGEGKRPQGPPDLAGFSSSRYKGVDFRI